MFLKFTRCVAPTIAGPQQDQHGEQGQAKENVEDHKNQIMSKSYTSKP